MCDHAPAESFPSLRLPLSIASPDPKTSHGDEPYTTWRRQTRTNASARSARTKSGFPIHFWSHQYATGDPKCHDLLLRWENINVIGRRNHKTSDRWSKFHRSFCREVPQQNTHRTAIQLPCKSAVLFKAEVFRFTTTMYWNTPTYDLDATRGDWVIQLGENETRCFCVYTNHQVNKYVKSNTSLWTGTELLISLIPYP